MTSDDVMTSLTLIVEKVINMDQNSRSQSAMKSFCEFPNCRPNPSAVVVIELVANCVHTADAPTPKRRNSVSAVCADGGGGGEGGVSPTATLSRPA